MKIIKSTEEIKKYCSNIKNSECFADTGFLYAASFDDDRLHEKAMEIVDLLSENHLPLFANVISRMEFIDLIFRKQVTQGAIQIFNNMKSNTIHKNLYNFLKNIRDLEASYKKDGKSYKLDESRIKKLRRELILLSGPSGWKDFCNEYIGVFLVNEWAILEEEVELNFIEILEGDTDHYIKDPIYWLDMVQLMGAHGMRGPDAMIANLYLKSRFSLLITADGDFEYCFEAVSNTDDKAVYILQ